MNSELKLIKKEILEEIKPSENNIINEFVEILKKATENRKIEIVVGGSFAKNTHIGNNYDCDIFVRFDANNKDNNTNNISKKLYEILKQIEIPFETIHGSRDYYNIFFKEQNFEIVPVLAVSKAEDAINIMDMSPFHVNWVKNNIKNFADDIRLMKMFLKAGKIYGAESYINGFSGHVVDILTIHYKGFEKTLKAISKWEKTTSPKFKKIIIDSEKNYKNEREIMFYLNKAKIDCPLVVIDPIIKDRNAAAALNNYCFDKLIDLAKDFLKKPSKDFFEIKKINLNKLKKKYEKTIQIIEIEPNKASKDVMGSKIKKIYQYVLNEINRAGFEIEYSEWEFEKKGKLFFIFKEEKIDETFWKKGPKIEMKEAIQSFKESHKNKQFKIIEENIFVKLNREIVDSKKIIKKLIKDEYIKNKSNNLKIIIK